MKNDTTLLFALRPAEASDIELVPKVIRLAKALDAKVELFTVLLPLIYSAVGAYGELIDQAQRALEKEARDELEQHAAAFRSAGVRTSLSIRVEVRAHEAIAARAEAPDVGLVVVGCPSRHRLHGVLKYTDWELVRLCPKPLLLLKSLAPWQGGSVLAAIDPGHAFDKPADLDRRILQHAARLSALLGEALHVVHAVAPPPQAIVPEIAPFPQVVVEMRDAAEARARSDVHALLEGLGPVAGSHLTTDVPSEAIPRVATTCGANLVVMGAVSRSALKRWLLGDTALKVLDQLRADVLIVKPDVPAAAASEIAATAA